MQVAELTTVMTSDSAGSVRPSIRERRAVSRSISIHKTRRAEAGKWINYCRQLDQLWRQFLTAGSTPDILQSLKQAAREAKRLYVYGENSIPSLNA